MSNLNDYEVRFYDDDVVWHRAQGREIENGLLDYVLLDEEGRPDYNITGQTDSWRRVTK
jgi:hypothetical protein